MAAPGRLRVPRPPALCQRSAMLFTHERGAEASVPAANYPVLIFFGEKETRPFQTWPNLISWGRRGRAGEAFPHRPRPREGAGMGRLGHSQLCLQAGTGGLCVPTLAAVPPLREQGVLGLECWKPRGDRRGARVLYVLISAAVTTLPHCHGKFGWRAGPGDGEQGSKWGRRGCGDKLHLP